MPRIRDLGVSPGFLPTGPHNTITDVSGVQVGHTTLIYDSVRTGVTAILPHNGNLFREKVPAGVHSINGFGKAFGFEQIREVGTIETPILLTNTLNVGRVADAVVAYMLRDNPGIGLTTGTVNAVVGECNDGFLNDLRGRHVKQEHVWHAIESASNGPVTEGNIGAGTGTQCYGFKGGIGTASRLVEPKSEGAHPTYTVGALVQTNFGKRRELRILGAPIGRHFRRELLPQSEPGPGSIMFVLATDAPLNSRQLRRLAVRAAFGLARTGSICDNGSGDFVIAFSTANQRHHYSDQIVETHHYIHDDHLIDQFFAAVIESVEEAIYNALLTAETMTGRDGHTVHALPVERVRELLRHYADG